jgi:DNA repair protein RecO (recombination protein O)
VLQPGNEVLVELRARTDSQLAAATVEAGRLRAGVTAEGLGLAAIGWLTGLVAAVLPEGDPHPRLYDALDALLDGIAAGLPALALGDGVVRFELLLMQELGFGLDLTRCAATGGADDLAYVSPRSSQAVSREAGAPYAAKLLPLPAFLAGGATTPGGVADGLALTLYFLERDLLAGKRRDILAARGLFTARLEAVSERNSPASA